MIFIKKRNGEPVEFDQQKIVHAIAAAFLEIDGEISDMAYTLARKIAKKIEKKAKVKELTVENIQNIVEEKLMDSNRKDVARAYARFRYKREIAREQKGVFYEAIAEKLEARNVKNQNANVDEYSFGGRMGEANDVMTKQYALDNCISKKAKENHLSNRIYIHDLSHYAVGDHNCLSIPFDHLLENGFNTRQTDVRPASSVNTAFQLIAVIFQLQSLQQFGGVSATHLDWTMVPYVRKSFAKHYKKGLKYIDNIKEEDIDYEIDFMLKNAKDYSITDSEWNAYNYKAYDFALNMLQEEVHQAVEGLYHNLNTLQSRSGN